MVDVKDFGEFETAWCPGCGNFPLLKCLKEALARSGLEPHQVLICSGIGQAAKTPHYLRCNAFNGLHGRAVPVATAAKLVNPGLKVIVESGDGCNYGEGGNHFLAGIRRNPDLTMLVHDNQIYGLTKGQASPTSMEGMHTKAQPGGVHNAPFNPVAVAVAMQASFVARGFVGLQDHLVELIMQALAHPGYALVDILQPCVSFNKVNTFKWYKDRCVPLPEDYDPFDWATAMQTANAWGDHIPVGIIYINKRKPMHDYFPGSEDDPLVTRPTKREELQAIIEGMG